MLGFAAAGAILVLALPPVLFAYRASATIEFTTDPARRIVAGLYPAEQTPSGLTFAWTGPTFAVTLPNLDRRVPWRLTLRIAASRPDGSTPALVTTVDGRTTSTVTLPAAGFADHVVALEPRADRPRTTTVSFRIAPTFVPAGDPRELGAQLDRITLTPSSGWPRLSIRWLPALAFGAAAGGLAGLLGVPASVALVWLALTALLAALVATTGLAPYAGVAWSPALGVGAGAAALAAAVLPRLRTGARAAVLITFTAAAIQMLVLLHPDMTLGDALFHAHRYQDVRAGRYFFTSTAPGDYQFPYPVGLYVVAGPFSRFTRSAVENATMLRIVVVLVNAVAAALLYRVVARWRADDEVAAASAVAAFHVVPLSFGVIGTGNLTNAFAQSMAIVSLALAAAIAAASGQSTRRWALSGLLFAFSATAFLSHSSTFAVLAFQLGIAGLLLLLRWRRQPAAGGWGAGALILAATLAAVALAFAVYYAHFGDVYRDAWARIAAETGRATEAAGGRTPYTRLVEAPQWLLRYYGMPIVILAAVGLGGWGSSRGGLRRGVSALLGAWLAAAVVFLIAGIITPVDLRHFYAAVPAVAALAGLATSWLWRSGTWTAAAAVVLGGWCLWIAWREAAGRFLGGS